MTDKIMYEKFDRKPSITAEKIAKIKYALERGATRNLAAQYAGITPRTLTNWIKKGETVAEHIQINLNIYDKLYLELWTELHKIETELQMYAFQKIKEASELPENWKAAECILIRRFRKEYGDLKNNTQINAATNTEGQPYNIQVVINAEDNAADDNS